MKATLHELELESPEPHALASFYARAFGYTFLDDGHGLVGAAVDRRLRLVPGRAKALGYAAFGFDDPNDLTALRQRLERSSTPFREAVWPGFAGAPLHFADPDGNRLIFGIPSPGPAQDWTGTAARPARLQHVVFATRDLPRLLTFYEDTIGFVLSDRVLDDEGGVRTVFLRCSNEHHSLAVFSAAEDRLDHHCFEAGDWGLIRDWGDHFAAEHIPLKWGPGRHGPGNNLFIFMHDPDGNWVEISAELERVAPDRPVGEWRHEERTLNSWGIGLLRS